MAMKEAETQSIEGKHRSTLPEVGWEDLAQPGTYVEEASGDLWRIPKEAFVNGGSPVLIRESAGASRLRMLSKDPFMPSLQARLLCAQHNIHPNF